MRELLPKLFGNNSSKTALCNSIKNGRMPQTLILEGDEGSGKHTFAVELAKALFCKNGENVLPCGSCRACERTDKRITPDLVFVRADAGKMAITVDKVREMTSQAQIGPCEMPVLVFVIEKADTMNVQAQNAWLLALENPPEDVVYILLCENASKLLETIISRSFLFRMDKFSPDKICEWIKRYSDVSYKDEDIYACAVSANGSIGKALTLLNRDTLTAFHEKREAVLEISRNVIDKSIPKAKRLKCVYSLPLKRDVLTEYFVLLRDVLHDVIMIKVDENANTAFFTPDMRDEAIRLSELCSLSVLYAYDEAVKDAVSSLMMNASVNGVRTSFAMKTGII